MKKLAVVLLFSVVAGSVLAQRAIDEETPHTFKERGYFGGGFGLNGGRDAYGNNYFFISLSPIVGYMVKPNLSVGTGFNWQRTSYSDIDVVLNQYGVSPFARYNFSQLFAQAEYNYISTPTWNNTERRSFNRMLVGLGYTQSMGGRGAINMLAMYDLMYKESDGAFASPWVFRVFFSF